jgi:prepilin-type N-terminal cleavage/methylation domain-containing protein
MKPGAPPYSSAGVRAFSLLEVLVAMAVLTIMMAFLFNLVAQTMRAWESGSKQIEAAQMARLGLDQMAQDLQFALGGSVNSLPWQGSPTKTNYVPFFTENNTTARIGLPSALPLAPSSGLIFAVAPLPSDGNQLCELGYVSVFVKNANEGEGYGTMRGRRYYLLRHAVSGTNATAAGTGNFFYANSFPSDQTGSDQWISEKTDSVSNVGGGRRPLIQNCYSLTFSYASNNSGVLSFSDEWTAVDRLPAGVLVTAKVMDEKTAARIASLRRDGLTDADVAEGATSDVARILREGTVEVRRFIPFANSKP